MSCPKNCDCLDCELCQRTPILIVDDRQPFNEMRYQLDGFKCGWDIRYDFDTKGLKLGGFEDDMLYVSQHKILVDYIKQQLGISI